MATRPAILFDLISVFIFSLGSFFIFSRCSALESKEIVINEIAWMGTEKAASDEWIELYNNANYAINLNGWSLKVQNSFLVGLKGNIPAKGFYLLERSDDQTLSDIPADAIFKGSLVNKGQKISLYNKANDLIDEIDCSQGWFGGDNSSKQTMERIFSDKKGISANNWQTSVAIGGTPKIQNSLAVSKNQKNKTEPKEQKQTEAINKNDLNASISNNAGITGAANLKTRSLAFLLAIFSGIIIIFLKRDLNNKINK